MATIYTAEEWNKKQKVDIEAAHKEKKEAEATERKKRVAAAKKHPGYMPPSGSKE